MVSLLVKIVNTKQIIMKNLKITKIHIYKNQIMNVLNAITKLMINIDIKSKLKDQSI